MGDEGQTVVDDEVELSQELGLAKTTLVGDLDTERLDAWLKLRVEHIVEAEIKQCYVDGIFHRYLVEDIEQLANGAMHHTGSHSHLQHILSQRLEPAGVDRTHLGDDPSSLTAERGLFAADEPIEGQELGVVLLYDGGKAVDISFVQRSGQEFFPRHRSEDFLHDQSIFVAFGATDPLFEAADLTIAL